MITDRVVWVEAVEQLTVEYTGLVAPGTVARCARRCLDRLVETGVEPAALPGPLVAMTRALLERELRAEAAGGAQ